MSKGKWSVAYERIVRDTVEVEADSAIEAIAKAKDLFGNFEGEDVETNITGVHGGLAE